MSDLTPEEYKTQHQIIHKHLAQGMMYILQEITDPDYFKQTYHTRYTT